MRGEELWLLPQRAIYWATKKTLLVADLHLGKSTYFRQHGLNVPVEILQRDLDVLELILSQVVVERLILLGDLFHSTENYEWEIFGEWLQRHSCKVHLIMGNHDILNADCYSKYNIKVHKQHLSDPPFVFSHKQVKNVKEGHYVFSGHIHPAIGMHGKANNSVRVPCFWFGEEQCVLPAFGKFTGNESIRPITGDKVFAIAGDMVFGM
ncbi:MAG: ligase-associated DNA damage response endonuclease PdeM [Bacteroidia bacterium]